MISFIVPAYNEEFELPQCLDAIKWAAAGRDFEIIVVDDASTDSTVAVAQKAGARVVSINRRQIAAARNAGARAAQGSMLVFVDADTHIQPKHVEGVLAALGSGCVGGGARVAMGGSVPRWGEIFLKIFSILYFGANLGAGAFLFTTRQMFDQIGGFDEQLFVGEEVYFSLALRKLGRFRILADPVLTSGRKLRMYSGREIFANMLAVLIRGKRGARSRAKLDIWYNGKREGAGGTGDSDRTNVARSGGVVHS